MKPEVSVIMPSFNKRADLDDCLPSLMNQSFKDFEVLFIDDGSTDGTTEYIQKNYPEIKILHGDGTLWYAGSVNLGAKHAKGDIFIIVNIDVKLHKDWLKELVKTTKKYKDKGAITSKIVFYENPSKVNVCGCIPHISGLTFCRGMNEDENKFNDFEEVPIISGCAFGVSRKLFEEVGGMDEIFESYLEEIDFSLRLRLRGYKCYLEPKSIVYHKYKTNENTKKYYLIDRNRYQMILKNYQWRSMIFNLPSLLLAEILTNGYALTRGWKFIKTRFRSLWWVATHFSSIMKRRKEVQKTRKISDKDLFKVFIRQFPIKKILNSYEIEVKKTQRS